PPVSVHERSSIAQEEGQARHLRTNRAGGDCTALAIIHERSFLFPPALDRGRIELDHPLAFLPFAFLAKERQRGLSISPLLLDDYNYNDTDDDEEERISALGSRP